MNHYALATDEFVAGSVKSCKTKCYLEPQCQFYVYNTVEKECKFYSIGKRGCSSIIGNPETSAKKCLNTNGKYRWVFKSTAKYLKKEFV